MHRLTDISSLEPLFNDWPAGTSSCREKLRMALMNIIIIAVECEGQPLVLLHNPFDLAGSFTEQNAHVVNSVRHFHAHHNCFPW